MSDIITNWEDISVDTPVWVKVKITDEWSKRYFCKFENNLVYTYPNEKTSTSYDKRISLPCWEYASLTPKPPIPLKPEPRRCCEDDAIGLMMLSIIPICIIIMIIITIDRLN